MTYSFNVNTYKKPLNLTHNPIYPHITKNTLNFETAKRKRKVNSMDIMATNNLYNGQMFIDGKILPLNRDYNDILYGKHSIKMPINYYVRYPPEYVLPYHRLPDHKKYKVSIEPHVFPNNNYKNIVRTNMISFPIGSHLKNKQNLSYTRNNIYI